jgi:hypothetical protein
MVRPVHELFPVILFVVPALAVAQAPKAQLVGDPIRGKEGNLAITYSLEGAPDQEFSVGLILCRDEGNLVKKRELKHVSGDVGTAIRPGNLRKIIWNPTAESLEILDGEPYWFEVTIVPISRGGMAWYVYAGGGAILGGTAYLLLTKKSPPPAENIPLPPGRPQ